MRRLWEIVRVSLSPVQAPPSLPEVPKSDAVEVARNAFINGPYKYSTAL